MNDVEPTTAVIPLEYRRNERSAPPLIQPAKQVVAVVGATVGFVVVLILIAAAVAACL